MSSRFQNLKRLVVQGCGNLNFLFSSSLVKSFLQLEHLEICKCPVLEEIIATEELREEEQKNIMFPQLKFLKIEDIENLTRLCTEMYIEFPSLKTLHIGKCPKFNAFVFENMGTDLQPLFNDKVAFPDLEAMMISHMDNLKMIWHKTKLALNSFGGLKLVKVEGCDRLKTLFPSNFGRFSRLEVLIIKECGSLEEIFRFQGSNFEDTHLMPVFQLKRASVSKCQSLKNIFPVSLARSLLQLELLNIIDCGILEEIVAKEGGGEPSTIKFILPKVTHLTLKNLPALTNFYPGVHTSEWPMLEIFVVYGCEKAKIFASEFLDFQKTNEKSHLGIPAQQPLFFIEKINPNLEVLGLSSQEIMRISHDQFPGHLFAKLKRLGIKDDKSAVFPLGLLERFYNPESLTLRHGSYKELFSYGEVEKHAGSLRRIKRLLLESLSDMKYMWKIDSNLNSILQNLEILEVEYCDNLINLVPPSASFKNLTTLIACYCKGMINLVTSSTAKSLELLREMSIEGCGRMAEIIANEGDVAEDEIVFSKLVELSLIGLESLTSFCSSNYTLNFSSLDVLIVRDCPKMKIFCEGGLSTPKLEMVCQNREDSKHDIGCWEGNLNATIQQLHNKVNVQSSKKDSGQPPAHHLQ